jgi:hypothetical protein
VSRAAQRAGRVIEKTGKVVIGARAHGEAQLYEMRMVLRKRRGRPPQNKQTAAWAARIEGAEFQDLGSLREKCRRLAWIEYGEGGGDLDALDEPGIVKLTEARRQALLRWYKKHP